MSPKELDIDSLIPHRRPMRLIDSILEVQDSTAATSATVGEGWPLVRGNAADPIVLVELAAQTAGVCIGHREKQQADGDPEGMGWLVGIKNARFFLETLPVGARVVVRTAGRYRFERLTEVSATAFVDGIRAAEIVLQIMQSETAEKTEPDGAPQSRRPPDSGDASGHPA